MPALEQCYTLEPLLRGPSSLIPPPPPDGFVERSLELQRLLIDHGYGRKSGSGITSSGLRLVSSIARAAGLRDWPHTRTFADYDALIAAVQSYLDAGR
jgi:hypothetical protein